MRKWIKKYKGLLLQLLIGAACGTAMAHFGFALMPELDGLMDLLVILVAMLAGVYLHILLHEGGHWLCGLLSGYRFVSFRIGSLVLMKNKEGYRLKKFSIPGTGGQCLLDPPDVQGGTFPYKLYNLGGGLANFFFSAVAVVVMLLWDNRLADVCLIPFIFMGVILGVTNLVPMRIGGIANDGYNLMTLGKDEISSKAFWQQLRVNRLQSDGERLKDMDEALFDLGQSAIEGNPLVDQMKLFWLQRLLDEGRFAEAEAFGQKLAEGKLSLQLFVNMIQVERLYLELTGQCRESVVKRWYTKDLKKYLKAVKGYPSTHRVKYAYAVCLAKDEKLAEQAKADFEKTLRSYPMAGEIESEKILLQRIEHLE